MNLPANLRHIEAALKNVSTETKNKAMFEEIEYSRKERELVLAKLGERGHHYKRILSSKNYSPLLEEVISGETTFMQRAAEIGFIPIARQNLHIFHEPFYLDEFFADVKYLDNKIRELYHSKD